MPRRRQRLRSLPLRGGLLVAGRELLPDRARDLVVGAAEAHEAALAGGRDAGLEALAAALEGRVDVELRDLALALALERPGDLDRQRAGLAARVDAEREVELAGLDLLAAGERVLEQLVDVGARVGLVAARRRHRRRSRPPGPVASRATSRMRSGRRRMKIGLQRKPRRNFEPSIGVMGGMRTACCGFVAVLCSLAWAAPAAAADHDVLVLGRRWARPRSPGPGAAGPPRCRRRRARGARADGRRDRREEAPDGDRRAQAAAQRRARSRPRSTPSAAPSTRTPRRRARKLRGTRATADERRAAHARRTSPRAASSPARASRRCG